PPRESARRRAGRCGPAPAADQAESRLSRLLGGGASRPGGARAAGASRGPVELDIAAAAGAVVQLVGGKLEIKIRRVDDSICPLLCQRCEMSLVMRGDTRYGGGA